VNLLDLGYLAMALPGAGPWYLWRRLRRRPAVPPWRRLGPGLEAGSSRGGVWIHAVSVGETLAARGLIGRLRADPRGLGPALTVTTATGLETARRTFAGLPVLPAPLDLSFAVRRVLAALRPRMLVLMEMELWPNLVRTAAGAGIPVVVANARLRERSLPRYRWLFRLFPGMRDGVRRWLVQDAEHAQRLRALGVDAASVRVTGNLKFDNSPPVDPTALRWELRARHGLGEHARILVLGSTHEGEEEQLLDALAPELRLHGDLRLVLAPRHPGRVAPVARSARSRGLGVGFWSRPGDPPDPQVLVVDTMGELARIYAVGDAVFGGGTLVPVGGHNLLEPASLGLPIVTGPHLGGVRAVAEELRSAGALVSASNAAEAAARALAWLADAPGRRAAGLAAQGVLARHQGALDRTMQELDEVLRDPPSPVERSPHA
jgi:3-deoxy-D-manno-octulosonic-acid transferase